MDPESFEEERRSHGVDGVADGNNWKTQQADDGALRVDDRGNSSALPFPDDPQPGVQHGMLRDEEGDAGLSEMLAAAMGSSAGASSFGLDELHVGGEEAGDQGPQKQEESQATRVVEQHPGPGYLPEAEAEELRARGWDPTRPSEVRSNTGIGDWRNTCIRSFFCMRPSRASFLAIHLWPPPLLPAPLWPRCDKEQKLRSLTRVAPSFALPSWQSTVMKCLTAIPRAYVLVNHALPAPCHQALA